MSDRTNLFSLRMRVDFLRKVLLETIHSSSRVIAIPTLLFIVLAGVGTWAVLWSSQIQERSAWTRAHAAANSTASALELLLFVNIQPAIALSVFVTQNPEWGVIHRAFAGLADGLFAGVMEDGYPRLLPTILRLAPFGVVSESVPRNDTWLQFENGTDSFLDADRRISLLRTAQLNATTIAWMVAPPAIYVRVPIFIRTPSQGQLWGSADDASMRRYCIECYRPDLGEKLWGFASAVLDPKDIVDGNFAQLAGLADLGYVYKLYRSATVDSSTPDILVGQSADDEIRPSDMLLRVVNLPNCNWFLFVMPAAATGWSTPWKGGLIAAAITCAALASVLVLSLLFSIERHRLLLHSLVPESVVERVQRGSESPRRTYNAFLNARTPADTILDIMSQLLRGVNPCIQDVILVRTAMKQSFDLYAPMGLRQHLLEATTDENVGAALVALVGADTRYGLDRLRPRFPPPVPTSGPACVDVAEIDVRSTLGSLCSLSMSSGLLPKLEELLRTSHAWEFDVFDLDAAANGRPLSALAFYLLNCSGLIGRFKLPVSQLVKFLEAIEDGYSEENPYHNRRHAADVLQSMHVILHKGGLVSNETAGCGGYVDDLTLLACYFAAALHDFGHGGHTNDYLIQSGDPLALTYNDRSPLENHHVSSACTKMSVPTMNFLANMGRHESASFRKLLIDLVLATDMKQHFNIVSQFGTMHRLNRGSIDGTDKRYSDLTTVSKRSNPSFPRSLSPLSELTIVCVGKVPLDDSERMISLQMALKLSDLSHVAAPFPLHLRWVCALEEEFFRQGDSEKACEFEVSPLFDRDKPGVTMSQIGFFDVVILPSFKHFADVFEGTAPVLHAARSNYDQWIARACSTGAVPDAVIQ